MERKIGNWFTSVSKVCHRLYFHETQANSATVCGKLSYQIPWKSSELYSRWYQDAEGETDLISAEHFHFCLIKNF